MTKPYTHQINGTFTKDFNNIALDLIIANPKFKITTVQYDWDNDKCTILIEFLTEQFQNLSRSFTLDCTEVWDDSRCLTEILSLPEFANAQEITEE